MELRSRMDLQKGTPIPAVIKWLQGLYDTGFTEDATIRIAKTTQQKHVLIVTEIRPDPVIEEHNGAHIGSTAKVS